MNREPNTQYVLSLSYGKDSLACLEAIKQLDLPLDRVVHAEVWATDTISADLPPMVEFKKKADKIIKERYGIEVEHICATKTNKQTDRQTDRQTYERQFYTMRFSKRRQKNCIYGFPIMLGAWCNSKLKMRAIQQANQVDLPRCVLQTIFEEGKNNGQDIRISKTYVPLLQLSTKGGRAGQIHKTEFSDSSAQGAKISTVQYLGIAADEPERIDRHSKPNVVLPLVLMGWDEAYCRKWCEENDLLSPIYTTAARGGCWFCHNQGVDQLRLLRKNYPDLWALLMKWDLDSPTTFKANGHTVHDYDKRFQMEDEQTLPKDKAFKWKFIKGDT